MLIGSIKKPRLLNKIKSYLNLNVTLLKNSKGQYSRLFEKLKGQKIENKLSVYLGWYPYFEFFKNYCVYTYIFQIYCLWP